MWWTGSAIFVTSYGWSVIDGLLGRLPSMEEKRTREILDPDELGANIRRRGEDMKEGED